MRKKPHAEITKAMKEAAENEILEQSRRIEFYLTEYSVELLATKMRDGEFVVPKYQREFTWEPERQSRFIESILMGLPIPFLFFWEMPSGKLEIVDGSQRLRTLEVFVLGGFRVTELEALPSVTGFSFSDLPESRQRKFKNRSIRGIVLNEHADEQARFEMFDRINTTSKVANMAEIRRGALAGPFMDLVVELAQRQDFADVAPVSKKQAAEREHEELVIRFLAYGDGLEGYKDRPSEFIFNYAKRMNQKFEHDTDLVDKYRARFVQMVRFVNRVFPFGFRRSATGRASPRARFEAIAVGSHLALMQDPGLMHRDLDATNWLSSADFRKITGSDGANAVSRLRGRINYVRDQLLENGHAR